MKNDWLNLDSRDAGYQTVLERLNASPYDELGRLSDGAGAAERLAL